MQGISDPLIRKSSTGIEKVQGESLITTKLGELKFLITNLNFLVPFFLNQIGTLFFYITLANSNLSLVVPATNSLIILFTTLTDIYLGEVKFSLRTLLGLIFVTIGICICVSSTI